MVSAKSEGQKQIGGCQGLVGRGEWGESLLKGYRPSFWGNDNVLELASGNGCTTCECTIARPRNAIKLYTLNYSKL